ncbi:hypothetical protein HB662_21120 [Roseomonas frigidaquae]|uniref:Lipoprotein n=1 Tax=Falsiroseomonas frigidaquae TaxID=487318 RepID=A0ABX1F4M0_9PROT|nr:hypothetical protein [Falsiroseomonas frigidaquae]NKE47292.1 hypothetical protein [Falsiroseomonas frigidaquae]
MTCFRALLLACAAALPGCGALLSEGTGAAAGIGSASLAEAVGASAAATTGIGIGVQAGARAGLQYAQRRTHRSAQLRLAAAAGPLEVGEVANWAVDHTIPLQPDEAGEVAVTRQISAGTLDCKEIVFSVVEPESRRFYTATVCRDGTIWRWASAEPATERWGSLQ